MCGVIGLSLSDTRRDATPEILEGAILLQHRGQDACGLVTQNSKGRIAVEKGEGLVTDVFAGGSGFIDRISGYMGIGHGKRHALIFGFSLTKYSTLYNQRRLWKASNSAHRDARMWKYCSMSC